MHNRTRAIRPAGSGHIGAVLAILAAALAAAPAAAQGEPDITPLTPMPARECAPLGRDQVYPGFVLTTVNDPAWVLCTSDAALTESTCEPTWFNTVFNPCWPQYNLYWKFAPGANEAAAAPMLGMGVGTFDGLYVRQGHVLRLYRGTGFGNPYGAIDVCGNQHAMPLVGPQYVSHCYGFQSPNCPDPGAYPSGTYFTAGEIGDLGCDSIVVGQPLRLRVLSINWKDGPGGPDLPADNNFDIRKDTGGRLVGSDESEWRADFPARRGLDTCYIRNSRMRADVVLESTPLITGDGFAEVWTEGDVDLTPDGTDSHTVLLHFDAHGRATHTFTAYQKTVGATLDLKDFTFTWKGAVYDQQPIIQPAYVLYGPPLDNYNGSAPDNEPLRFHLRMLLGPKVGTRGEWAKGQSTLAKHGLPQAIQQHIKPEADGVFNANRQVWGDPWDSVRPDRGAVCEHFAELLKEALLVAGVPAAKLDRKSVVSSVVARPSWLGIGSTMRLHKAFVEGPSPTAAAWLNEGACGVLTDDQGWQYYDVAGTTEIGVGNWANPHDSAGNNLWFEPGPGQTGPVMYSIRRDRYGTWFPQVAPPYSPSPIAGRQWVPQIEVIAVDTNGSNVAVVYRTDGAMAIGQNVLLTLEKRLGGSYGTVATHLQSIAQEWDNLQSHTFGAVTSGTYRVSLQIQTATGDVDGKGSWKAQSVPILVP